MPHYSKGAWGGFDLARRLWRFEYLKKPLGVIFEKVGKIRKAS